MHRRLDARAHLVDVRGGIERIGSLLLDQLPRELELGLLDLAFRDLDLLDRPHLAGVKKLLHDEALQNRPDHHDVLLAARAIATDGAALGLAQRAGEQRIRLGAPLVGSEVVGLVEEYRIDRLDRHEFGDLRAVRPRLLHRLELLGGEHHILVLRELIPLHHVFARHGHVLFDAEVLLPEPGPASLVEEIEGDRMTCLGRGIELHRNRHESKGNRQ